MKKIKYGWLNEDILLLSSKQNNISKVNFMIHLFLLVK